MEASWVDSLEQAKEYRVTQNHGAEVTANPERYRLKASWVDSQYEKYGEKKGQEGKAREAIIRAAVDNGFIRVRMYRDRWSINVKRLTPIIRKALVKWADNAVKNPKTGQYFTVKIYETDNDNLITTDVKNIWFESY